MSQKGLYKKTIGSGWDHSPDSQRPRERRFFEKAESGQVGKKNKSKEKGKPRANHKHIYEIVLVWRKSHFSNENYGYVGKYCSICGRKEKDFTYELAKKKERQYFGKLKHFFEDENGVLTSIDENAYRKTIFVGGSKMVESLSLNAKNELIDRMNCGYKIIVGDAIGADLQIQKLLLENGYENVIVYYSGEQARINLGAWQTKYISANKYDTDEELQKCKGLQMAFDCDEGFMLVRGISADVITNLRRLIELKKSCFVVLYDERKYGNFSCASYYCVKSGNDIERLLERIDYINANN